MAVLDLIEQQWPRIAELTAQYHFTNLKVMGSVARRQEGAESDIDFIADPIPESGCSLFDLHQLERELKALLGRDVDICTPGGFHWYAFEIDPGNDANKRRQIKFNTLAIELVERLENIENYSHCSREVFLNDPMIRDAVLCNMHIVMALARTLPDNIFNTFFWYDRKQTIKNQDAEVMWNTFARINAPLRKAVLNYLGVESLAQLKAAA